MEIRPAKTDEELTALVEVRNRVQPDDPIALEDIHSMLAAVEEMIHLLAWAGSRTVGAAAVGTIPTNPNPFFRIWVVPEARRRGIGSALYREISVWASGRGKDTLEIWVEDADADGLDFARKRGFDEIGRELRLALALNEIEAPKVEPPDEIEITTWAERPELIGGIYEVALEAIVDIPGEDEQVEPFEDWLAHQMQGAGDRAEATFVALAGEEVVGFSKFSFTSAQPTVAHHDLTGVKRAWRGRGIARSLKQAQIAWAKNARLERLETRNEERNEPIRRLNEEFGYRPWSGRTQMRGPISGAEP